MANFNANITGDSSARAAGFNDYSDYQNQLAALKRGQGSSGGNTGDPIALAQAAQQLQVQANQPAIQTLQGQQKSLQEQYKTLLDSVINQGSATMNTVTSGENAYLGSRGLLSQAGLGNTQLSQAQQTQQAQNQSAAAQVGQGSATDINALAAQIASLQAGNVGNALNFSGGINTAQQQAAAQIQAAQIAGTSKPFTSINSLTSPILNTVTGESGLP